MARAWSSRSSTHLHAPGATVACAIGRASHNDSPPRARSDPVHVAKGDATLRLTPTRPERPLKIRLDSQVTPLVAPLIQRAIALAHEV